MDKASYGAAQRKYQKRQNAKERNYLNSIMQLAAIALAIAGSYCIIMPAQCMHACSRTKSVLNE